MKNPLTIAKLVEVVKDVKELPIVRRSALVVVRTNLGQSIPLKLIRAIAQPLEEFPFCDYLVQPGQGPRTELDICFSMNERHELGEERESTLEQVCDLEAYGILSRWIDGEENWGLYSVRGHIALRLGWFEQAVTDASTAILLNGESFEAYGILAIAQESLNRNIEAKANWRIRRSLLDNLGNRKTRT